MFLKMVKHETRASFRVLLPLFCGILVMGALARLSIWLIEMSDFILVQVFGTLFIGIFALSCIAGVVLTMVLMMVRFGKSVHGDEGYLTNTLPVNTHTIILSRLLISFVALLCSYVVVFLGYKVCTIGIKGAREFEQFFLSAFREADSSEIWTMVRLLGTMLVGMLSNILMIFAAISIGHSFPNKKVGLSILFYFVLYFVQQTVSVIGIFVLSAILAVGMNELEMLNQVPNIIMLFSVFLSLLTIIAYYFLTWIMLRKRLNLS